MVLVLLPGIRLYLTIVLRFTFMSTWCNEFATPTMPPVRLISLAPSLVNSLFSVFSMSCLALKERQTRLDGLNVTSCHKSHLLSTIGIQMISKIEKYPRISLIGKLAIGVGGCGLVAGRRSCKRKGRQTLRIKLTTMAASRAIHNTVGPNII